MITDTEVTSVSSALPDATGLATNATALFGRRLLGITGSLSTTAGLLTASDDSLRPDTAITASFEPPTIDLRAAIFVSAAAAIVLMALLSILYRAVTPAAKQPERLDVEQGGKDQHQKTSVCRR